MSLGKIIRQQRESLKLTLDEVSRLTNYSKPYLSTVETGRVKNPPADELLVKLEEVLNFEDGLLVHIAHMEKLPADLKSQFELIETENGQLKAMIKELVTSGDSSVVKLLDGTYIDLKGKLDPVESGIIAGMMVPVINKENAGYPVDFGKGNRPASADDYIRYPGVHDSEAFAVRVQGDMMAPEYGKGDIVVFGGQGEVSGGVDCFVRLNNPAEAVFTRIYYDGKDKVRLQPRNNKYPPLLGGKENVDGVWPAIAHFRILDA